MSYFKNNIVYIIVETSDITTEMLNHMKIDFNSTDVSKLRSTVSGTSKKLFKILAKEGVPNVFSEYPWFNSDDILVELQKTEWTGN